MIGLIGLDDGDICHDVLDVDRVGLRILIEDVNLALCIRNLELDPGVDPSSLKYTVVKSDDVIVLFLTAVTAVREVSCGDVRSIASKALTGWTLVVLKLKQVLKDTKSLVKCISKLKVGEGGFFSVRSDGDHIVCAYVLSGDPGLKHLTTDIL